MKDTEPLVKSQDFSLV